MRLGASLAQTPIYAVRGRQDLLRPQRALSSGQPGDAEHEQSPRLATGATGPMATGTDMSVTYSMSVISVLAPIATPGAPRQHGTDMSVIHRVSVTTIPVRMALPD